MINLPTPDTLERALRASLGNPAYDRIAALRDAIQSLQSVDYEVLDVASDGD